MDMESENAKRKPAPLQIRKPQTPGENTEPGAPDVRTLLVGWVKGRGDGGFQGGVGAIGYGAVGLPKDVAVRSGEEDVGVIGRGEIDQFFPFVLVIEKWDEMRLL